MMDTSLRLTVDTLKPSTDNREVLYFIIKNALKLTCTRYSVQQISIWESKIL